MWMTLFKFPYPNDPQAIPSSMAQNEFLCCQLKWKLTTYIGRYCDYCCFPAENLRFKYAIGKCKMSKT